MELGGGPGFACACMVFKAHYPLALTDSSDLSEHVSFEASNGPISIFSIILDATSSESPGIFPISLSNASSDPCSNQWRVHRASRILLAAWASSSLMFW